MTRLRLLTVTGVIVMALATAAGALGHAELVGSQPADGDVLTASPPMLVATFSEELAESSTLVVVDGGGNEIASGGVDAADETRMTVDLPALEPGAYVARWTAVAADDQGVTRGEINFSVASAVSPAPVASPTPVASPAPAPAGSDISVEVLLSLAVAVVLLVLLAWYLARRR